jgi:hypothetical protein
MYARRLAALRLVDAPDQHSMSHDHKASSICCICSLRCRADRDADLPEGTLRIMNRAMTAARPLLGLLLIAGLTDARAQAGDGLLGIPWGTRFGQVRDRFALTAADSDSVSTRYSSNIEHLAGAKVEECFLEFRRGAFVGAGLLTRGADNTHRLLTHLFRTYGKGREESARAYQWLSDTTHVFYDESSDGEGFVYWYSRKLYADAIPERPLKRSRPLQQHDPR